LAKWIGGWNLLLGVKKGIGSGSQQRGSASKLKKEIGRLNVCNVLKRWKQSYKRELGLLVISD
jgi:hypothetical protein